jgi:hypothetical protein
MFSSRTCLRTCRGTSNGSTPKRPACERWLYKHRDHPRQRLFLEKYGSFAVEMGRGCVLNALCAGTKRNGERCTATVEQAQRYCWWRAHPDNAEECRRAASKGGRGKASREIKDLKKQLEDLAADVLKGNVDRGDGAVVNQIINTRARLI